DPADPKRMHGAVVQASAAHADADAKAHDGVAVDAGHAFNAADATALGESANDLNLLVAREVHGGPNPSSCEGPKRRAGKVARKSLYLPEWSLLRGPIPGF